jgi:AcrR family transcriptional regulator
VIGEMTLRDHARGAVRDEVMKQAWLLFSEQGFEATTVDQIAEAAGMSRRTFFRYFAGKDELVLERLVAAGDQIADALRERPSDEPAWPALRAAFDDIVATQERHAERSRALQLMLRDEPAVRASVLERRRRWQDLLAPLVALRLPGSDEGPGRGGNGPDVRAAAVSASALACLDAAQETWADHPGARLATLLDEAMGAVSPLV